MYSVLSRDDDRENSDVDVVIRISEADLFTLAGIKNELEDRLHKSVDLITYREDMNQFLRNRIDGEAVYA